jgi:hypothetical protein
MPFLSVCDKIPETVYPEASVNIGLLKGKVLSSMYLGLVIASHSNVLSLLIVYSCSSDQFISLVIFLVVRFVRHVTKKA